MAKAKKKAKEPTKPKTHKRLGLAKFIPTRPKKKIENDLSDREHSDQAQAKQVVPKKADKNASLIDRCKQQMSSSLLRLIDETLYSSDSHDVNLDKDKFLAYHDAYTRVAEKWPTKPIDFIVKFIKKRLLIKRSIDKLKFADVGCGKEPTLKMRLPHKAKVHSFDLVSAHKHVTEANMEGLPLDNESVNCAVYSLSLMAKNLGSVILEAKRILKVGGSMLVVEVTSRFEGHEKRFASQLERLGLKQQSTKALPPNGYFTFFHFTKIDTKLDYPGSALKIRLKPCVYKAR